MFRHPEEDLSIFPYLGFEKDQGPAGRLSCCKAGREVAERDLQTRRFFETRRIFKCERWSVSVAIRDEKATHFKE